MHNRLIVLMWKHWIVRKRKIIYTSFELASVVIGFLAMFLLRNTLREMLEKRSLRTHLNPLRTDAFPLEPILGPPLVVYAPQSWFTAELMDQVGEELNLTKLEEFPEPNESGYYGFNDKEFPNVILNDFLDKCQAVVVFQNMLNSMPYRLNYSIETKVAYKMGQYKYLDRLEPHERFDKIHKSFIRLQWAIDRSFLKLRTGNPISRTVSLQEIPYEIDADKGRGEAIVIIMYGRITFSVSLMFPFMFLVTRLAQDRSSGIQELLKMAGVSPRMLAISHFLNMLPTCLLYIIAGTVLMTISSSPFLPRVNVFLVFIIAMLYAFFAVSLAFATSFLIKNVEHANIIAVCVFLFTGVICDFLLLTKILPIGIIYLLGFLPHAPLFWFMTEVAMLVKEGQSADFSTWTVRHTKINGTILESIIFHVMQIIVWTSLSCYLIMVCPGAHGVGLPWNYCFQKSKHGKTVRVHEDLPARDPQFFEEPPKNKNVGIKIANVTKIYGKGEAVLQDISFDIYVGEIVILLGHNGAGKTTLNTIITGGLDTTHGDVYVNGNSIKSDPLKVQKQLGFCTQHNIFFNDVNVIEHVMIFGLLRGIPTFKAARDQAHALLTDLGINDKSNIMADKLSGGMKRRLQLACALAGGSKVLILDEPTSGLDVETRRELWDLLLKLRGNRTVLLTTHFMEEADALGDRIAALHQGKLRCHATPMHLKKHIGTGYRITFVTIGPPKEAEITAAMNAVIPEATLRETSLNFISYSLPTTTSSKFPQLFRAIESKKSELGIESIGVGMATLEEVFVKLCSDVDQSLTEDERDTTVRVPTYQQLKGCALYTRQILVLFQRRFRYLIHTKYSFVILQVFIPLLFMFLFTFALLLSPAKEEQKLFDLDQERPDDNVSIERVLYYPMKDPGALRTHSARFKKVKFVAVADIGAVLRTSEGNLTEDTKYQTGIKLNDTSVEVLYKTRDYHAAPVALNLLSNVLAAQFVPLALRDGQTIVTHLRTDPPPPNLPMETKMIAYVIGFQLICIIITIINVGPLIVNERYSGSRHIHIMSGCPPTLHWLTRLLFDGILYAVVLCVPTIIAIAVFDKIGTLCQPQALGASFIVLFLGLLANLSFIYLLCFFTSESNTMGVLCVVTFLTLVLGIIHALYIFESDKLVSKLLTVPRIVFPSHTWSFALIKVGNVARLNHYCELNKKTCHPNLEDVPGMDVEKCCHTNEQPASYYGFAEYSPGIEMVLFVAQILIYMTLVILTQNGIFGIVYEKYVSKQYKPPTPKFSDKMVLAEKEYVNKTIKIGSKQIPDAMLFNDVHKKYVFLCQPSCNPVIGVSFSVKKGECFGVLGVNGAGKSTTFKMIVSETCATKGQIFANGHHLTWRREQYVSSLSYCPQFFGLDEFMTGAHNLKLLLTIRGLKSEDVAKEVDEWIQVVGLQKYRDMPVSHYSGGCKRRMATAAALSNFAPLTLLDEPTSGVDVSARRRVWAALRRGLRQQRAVILTSHSMDEMEALCNRIMIMSAGEVCALGSPPVLRAAHAAGHALVLKINSDAANTESDGKGPVTDLKNYIQKQFKCTLKDQHKTMLHYHINEVIPYSELFSKLETLQAAHGNLIEDYTVTETSLEEVFLSYADANKTKASA